MGELIQRRLIKEKKMRRGAAKRGRKNQTRLKRWVVRLNGKGDRNSGDRPWSDRPAVFRALES
jgi:hypothetical protein